VNPCQEEKKSASGPNVSPVKKISIIGEKKGRQRAIVQNPVERMFKNCSKHVERMSNNDCTIHSLSNPFGFCSRIVQKYYM
jgi:hypothetical protein